MSHIRCFIASYCTAPCFSSPLPAESLITHTSPHVTIKPLSGVTHAPGDVHKLFYIQNWPPPSALPPHQPCPPQKLHWLSFTAYANQKKKIKNSPPLSGKHFTTRTTHIPLTGPHRPAPSPVPSASDSNLLSPALTTRNRTLGGRTLHKRTFTIQTSCKRTSLTELLTLMCPLSFLQMMHAVKQCCSTRGSRWQGIGIRFNPVWFCRKTLFFSGYFFFFYRKAVPPILFVRPFCKIFKTLFCW